MNIFQANPSASYRKYKSQIDDAVSTVMERGRYILGEAVAGFEAAFAAYHGSAHCVGAANGTDAIELVLRALGIGPGDQVVTVPNTAVATVAAIERAGAVPRFVDISPTTLTMSVSSLEELLECAQGIKAVIPVHLFGCPADMIAICRLAHARGIPVIEDCAQAHGAAINGKKCGTFGIAGTFSFYPTKNLGALGDGGGVVTDSRELAETITRLRQYGWRQRYISECSGINSRLDELQAAILSVKLRGLDSDNHERRRIAQFYTAKLSQTGLELPKEALDRHHVYHQYVVRLERRDELADFLKKRQIGTAIHYPELIHRQPAYRQIPLPVRLKNAEEINASILSLPMYPELSMAEIDTVTTAVKEFFS